MTLLASGDWRWRAVDQQTERAIAALRRLPYRAYLRTSHWFRVRTLALDRSGRQCALCPSTMRLEVHHKTYVRRGFEAPEDVVVLCDSCHTRHHRTLPLEVVVDQYGARRARASGPAAVVRVLRSGLASSLTTACSAMLQSRVRS